MNATEKFEASMKVKSSDTRIAVLEQAALYSNQALERIESKLIKINDDFDRRFERFENKISDLMEKMDSNNKWLLCLVISAAFNIATLGLNMYQVIKH